MVTLMSVPSVILLLIVISVLLSILGVNLARTSSTEPGSVLTFLLILGFAVGLIYGGAAVLKHYTLRLLLWLSGTFPRNITAFLTSCAARGLVQRVGGGWRFPHNLIRDYFAELEMEDGKY
jgi:hypothetical protein